MSIRYGETKDSRSGPDSSPTYSWFVAGTSDREYCRSLIAFVSPVQIIGAQGVLYRQDREFAVDFTSSNYAVVSVPYVPADQASPAVGSLRVSFDTTGGTATAKAAYEHVATYPKSPYAAKDHDGAIGVQQDGTIEGCEVIVPALKLTVAVRHPAGYLSMNQIRNLARATGTVNNATLLGFEAGEVLFLGAAGSQGTDSETEVSYQLACSENITDFELGGITVAAKDGWDYAWVEFASAEDSGTPIQTAMNIHVERVYRRKNLAAILGFGG